jgi:hypothetical protein
MNKKYYIFLSVIILLNVWFFSQFFGVFRIEYVPYHGDGKYYSERKVIKYEKGFVWSVIKDSESHAANMTPVTTNSTWMVYSVIKID